MPEPARRGTGFTLIELLVAIALMAVLALMSLRGLDSVLGTRGRIAEHSDAMRALSITFSQLEEDLRRSWAVRQLLPTTQAIGVVREGEGLASLQILREVPLQSAGQIQRVAYRLREGVLERGFAPWSPVLFDAQGRYLPPAFTWQPLVDGVRALQVRGWVAGQGWLASDALALVPLRPADAVPVTGVEVVLERAGGERLLRVFAVKD